MSNAKATPTPTNTPPLFVKNGISFADPTLYRYIIGSL